MFDQPNLFTRPSQPGRTPVAYLPDLTLWYRWHLTRRTLPEAWRGDTLPQIAAALGVPAWVVEHPWRVEHDGITVTTEEADGQRTISYETPHGTLAARWTLGPDGDWWQTEYPVKTVEDLTAARAIVAARRYVMDESEESTFRNPPSPAVLALELPMRPYSDILHTLLGWGEGLMLLKGEGAPLIAEMLEVLEEKLAGLADQLAARPGDVLYAADNLDGQYISPRTFRASMTDSYQRSGTAAREHGKRLVVHTGGPIRRLLPLLAEAGVDAVEGVAPPPQGDASLVEARAAAGPDLILWGGIPQDYLLPTHDRAEFEAAVAEAARQAVQNGSVILGVADRVPVNADIDRLRALPELIAAVGAA